LGPREFLSRSRVVIVAGKGGVGKTTLSGALAHMAVEAGLSPLLVDVQGGQGLARAFDLPGPLDDDEREVAPGIRARAVNPDATLVDYLESRGLARISRRLVRSGVLEVLATTTPGVKDLLVLSRIRQLEREGAADVIVVDAPATGHSITFLTAARHLGVAAGTGPLATQGREVQAMLADARRCRVMLVARAEETPVNEMAEGAFALEDQVGVALTPVVVNALEPSVEVIDGDPVAIAHGAGVTLSAAEGRALNMAVAYRRRRRERQNEQLARLAALLPLPQIHLPLVECPVSGAGRGGMGELARALAEGVDRLGEAR
jgi:Mrp family chromosome partitioning ATPase